jgi:ABC-type antimicrobial peptide transport system permease subunit
MYEGAETPSSVYMVGKKAFLSPVGSGRRPLMPGLPGRSFVVRGRAADIAALRTTIPAAMRDILPPRGLTDVYGSDDQRRDLIAQQRFLAKVFGTFGVLSLALCALGLYSVLAYSVSRRLREHGIRVALGATRKHIFLDVLHEGAILVIAGTAVGGLATIWSNKLVDPYIGLLYHIDALALVAAEVVLVGVALAAMVRPAIRATRTDPVEVLRAV